MAADENIRSVWSDEETVKPDYLLLMFQIECLCVDEDALRTTYRRKSSATNSL